MNSIFTYLMGVRQAPPTPPLPPGLAKPEYSYREGYWLEDQYYTPLLGGAGDVRLKVFERGTSMLKDNTLNVHIPLQSIPLDVDGVSSVRFNYYPTGVDFRIFFMKDSQIVDEYVITNANPQLNQIDSTLWVLQVHDTSFQIPPLTGAINSIVMSIHFEIHSDCAFCEHGNMSISARNRFNVNFS